jgi:hypothetical protein
MCQDRGCGLVSKKRKSPESSSGEQDEVAGRETFKKISGVYPEGGLKTSDEDGFRKEAAARPGLGAAAKWRRRSRENSDEHRDVPTAAVATVAREPSSLLTTSPTSGRSTLKLKLKKG